VTCIHIRSPLACSMRAIALASLLLCVTTPILANEAHSCGTQDSTCYQEKLTQSLSEDEIEQEEALEAESINVQLLQSKRKTPAARISSSVKKSSEAQAAENGDAAESEGSSMVTSDHNGRVCILCDKPLPHRLGGKTYNYSRMDCGGKSSPNGPTQEALNTPVAEFSRAATKHDAATNGFCELNFAKSCADAIINQEYMYFAKSTNLAHHKLKENAKWDGRYCQKNGFLTHEFRLLQQNFTALQEKASALCKSKYAKFGLDKMTFTDMTRRARYDDPAAPTLEDAEFLAAWNCAMGDLGCDIALCSYSFCEEGKDDSSIGLYDQCKGWDPVKGMPIELM